jgi:hypothetical protein
MSIAFFVLIAAVIGSAAMASILTWVFLRFRSLEAPGGGSRDLLAMEEQLRRLAEELDSAHGQIEGLRERLDFTEKLLGSGSDRDDEAT